MDPNVREIGAEVQQEAAVLKDLTTEVGKVIVGQKALIERVAIGLLSEGHLLVGSVLREGKRLRITWQLVNVADGYHLWSERYDRDMQDVFAIQD